MSEARAIGNLYGNVVATIFVSWWEGALDVAQAKRVLAGGVAGPKPSAAITASGNEEAELSIASVSM
jgi:hypothetical protein